MTLTPGVRLGSFEITTAIGAGGMGEVYRAKDAKLGSQTQGEIVVLDGWNSMDASRNRGKQDQPGR